MNETLAFCTTDDLIEELVNRTTFAGLIICSVDEHKFAGQQHPNLKLMTTADAESTLRLLHAAVESVENEVTGN